MRVLLTRIPASTHGPGHDHIKVQVDGKALAWAWGQVFLHDKPQRANHVLKISVTQRMCERFAA